MAKRSGDKQQPADDPQESQEGEQPKHRPLARDLQERWDRTLRSTSEEGTTPPGKGVSLFGATMRARTQREGAEVSFLQPPEEQSAADKGTDPPTPAPAAPAAPTLETLDDISARLGRLKGAFARAQQEAADEGRGVLFGPPERAPQSPEQAAARTEQRQKVSEALQRAGVKGTMLQRLQSATSATLSSIAAVEGRHKSAILRQLRHLDTTGLRPQAQAVAAALRAGRVFEAENLLIGLQVTIAAKRLAKAYDQRRGDLLEDPGSETAVLPPEELLAAVIALEETSQASLVPTLRELLSAGRHATAERQLLQAMLAAHAEVVRQRFTESRQEELDAPSGAALEPPVLDIDRLVADVLLELPAEGGEPIVGIGSVPLSSHAQDADALLLAAAVRPHGGAGSARAAAAPAEEQSPFAPSEGAVPAAARPTAPGGSGGAPPPKTPRKQEPEDLEELTQRECTVCGTVFDVADDHCPACGTHYPAISTEVEPAAAAVVQSLEPLSADRLEHVLALRAPAQAVGASRFRSLMTRREAKADRDFVGIQFRPRAEALEAGQETKQEGFKERLRTAMARTAAKGSILLGLATLLQRSGPDALQHKRKQGVYRQLRRLDTVGFGAEIQKIAALLRSDRVLQAENGIVELTYAIRRKATVESLREQRERRLHQQVLDRLGENRSLLDLAGVWSSAARDDQQERRGRVVQKLDALEGAGEDPRIAELRATLEAGNVYEAEEGTVALVLTLEEEVALQGLIEAREQELAAASGITPMSAGLTQPAQAQVLLQAAGPQPLLEAGAPTPPVAIAGFSPVVTSALAKLAHGPRGLDERLQATATDASEASGRQPEHALEREVAELLWPGPESVVGVLEPLDDEPMSVWWCQQCGAVEPQSHRHCRWCGARLGQVGGRGRPSMPTVPISDLGFHAAAQLRPPSDFVAVSTADSALPHPEVLAEMDLGELEPIDEGGATLPALEPLQGVSVAELEDLDEAATGLVDHDAFVPTSSATTSLQAVGTPEGALAYGALAEGLQELEPIGAAALGEARAQLATAEETQALPWSGPVWEGHLQRGLQARSEGDLAGARDAFLASIESQDNVAAHRELADLYLTLGWGHLARDEAEAALAVDGADAQAWELRGRAMAAMDKPGAAIQSFDQAVEHGAHSSALLQHQAESWLAIGKPKLAVECYEKALRSLDAEPKDEQTAARRASLLSAAIAAGQRYLHTRTDQPTPPLAAASPEEAEEMQPLDATEQAVTSTTGLRNGVRGSKGAVAGRGLTNGRTALVNGRSGLVNGRSGLVNGRSGLINGRSGLVNGRSGLVNGRSGLVNGRSGLVNGREREGISPALSRQMAKAAGRQRTRVVALSLVGMLVVTSLVLVLLSTLNPGPAIVADGSLGDWGKQSILYTDSDGTDEVGRNSVDMIDFGMVRRDNLIGLTYSVAGDVLDPPGDEVELAHILLDTDQRADTGYALSQLGADAMVQIYGWGGKVRAAQLLTFDTERSPDDWNAFGEGVAVSGGTHRARVEVVVPVGLLGDEAGPDLRAMVHTLDRDGHEDWSSVAFSTRPGVVQVSQRSVSLPVIPYVLRNDVLSVSLQAQGREVQLSTLGLTIEGTFPANAGTLVVAIDGDGDGHMTEQDQQVAEVPIVARTLKVPFTPPLVLRPSDAPTRLVIAAEVPLTVSARSTFGIHADVPGTELSTGIASLDAFTTGRSYVNEAPNLIRIDGAFSDWDVAAVERHVDGNFSTSATVDLTEYRTLGNSEGAFFLLEVRAGLLSGELAPDTVPDRPPAGPRTPPTGPRPPPPVLPVLEGVDTAYVFIDIDKDLATGFSAQMPLGADFLVTVLGRQGVVLSRTLQPFTGSSAHDFSWGEPTTIEAGNDDHRLEIGVSASLLSDNGSKLAYDAYFWIKDFSERNYDTSDSAIAGDPPLAVIAEGSGAAAGDLFGYDIAVVGDLNADGIDDIAVGAPYNDAGANDGGRVYLFFGDANFGGGGAGSRAAPAPGVVPLAAGAGIDDLDPANADVSISGLLAGGHLGWAVAGRGSVNADAMQDLIIGAPDSGAGRAYVYYGRANWANIDDTADADVTLTGEAANDRFGYDVSIAGNLNGALSDDIAVGAPMHAQAVGVYVLVPADGRAYVFYGDGAIPANAAQADVKLDGATANAFFGGSVAGAGDHNGDGIDDLLVGSSGEYGLGSADIFLGGDLGNTVMVSQTVWNNNNEQVHSLRSIAQSFVATQSGRLLWVDVGARDRGADDNGATVIQMEIQTTAANLPSGVAISSREGQDFAAGRGGSINRITFSTPATLVLGQTYWLVVASTHVGGNGAYVWYANGNNPYAGGGRTVNGGGFVGGWAAAIPNRDMMFDLLIAPDRWLSGESAGDQYGFSVAGANDLIGDGKEDLLVGAPTNDNTGANAGMAYLVAGAAGAAALDSLFVRIWTNFPGGGGLLVSPAMISAQGFVTPAAGAAVTNLWFAGFETVVNPQPILVEIQTDQGGLPSGIPVWGQATGIGNNPAAIDAGFVNLDPGFVIVLAPNTRYWVVFSTAEPAGYGVFRNDNNPYAPSTAAQNGGGGWFAIPAVDVEILLRTGENVRISGEGAGDQFGYSVGAVNGDLDGDGEDEIVIGAPYAESGANADTGIAYVFDGPLNGNLAAGNADWANEGANAGDHFGWAVGGGDVTDDGIPEVVIGAPHFDGVGADSGYGGVFEIPEYELLVPSVAMIALFILFRRRASSRRGGRTPDPLPTEATQ